MLVGYIFVEVIPVKAIVTLIPYRSVSIFYVDISFTYR